MTTCPNCGARNASATPAEQRILRLLARGMTNQEIARALDVSIFTVKTHLSRLSLKLGVHGRGKLVASYSADSTPAAIAAGNGAHGQ